MKSISNLLQSTLVKKAKELDKLRQIVHACLPDNCRPHIKAAGINENSLILTVDSPVWSSRIRLYSNNILELLEQHNIAKIQSIRIRLDQAEPVKPEQKH